MQIGAAYLRRVSITNRIFVTLAGAAAKFNLVPDNRCDARKKRTDEPYYCY